MKEQTGFSDVDGSGRPGALVDYLALVAQHVGDFRRQGYGLMRLMPGDAVLDVGCGAGEVCVELAAIVGARGRVAGVDLSEAMVEAARRTVAASGRPIQLQPASIYELPFADGALNAVRAERVFQHLDNPEVALREMMRVTKPGGRVLAEPPSPWPGGPGAGRPGASPNLRSAAARHVADGHESAQRHAPARHVRPRRTGRHHAGSSSPSRSMVPSSCRCSS